MKKFPFPPLIVSEIVKCVDNIDNVFSLMRVNRTFYDRCLSVWGDKMNELREAFKGESLYGCCRSGSMRAVIRLIEKTSFHGRRRDRLWGGRLWSESQFTFWDCGLQGACEAGHTNLVMPEKMRRANSRSSSFKDSMAPIHCSPRSKR